MSTPFLSCDWGTSGFRLRLLARPGLTVLGELQRPEGVGQLGVTPGMAAAERATLFATHWQQRVAELSAQVGQELTGLPAVLSGMASANVGWHEVPYATCPFQLDGRDWRWVRLSPPGHQGPVFIGSGLRSADDIMRGEESQAIGLLADPALASYAADSLLLLPGTHSKHLRLQGGLITDFATHMTGELYAVLGQQSLLRHSLAGAHFALPADEPVFVGGVRLGLDLELGQALFRVRTGHVLHGRQGAAAAATLSGLLLGAELRGLLAQTPATLPLLLAAAPTLTPLYQCAAAVAGLTPRLRTLPASALEHALSHAHATFLAHQGL
jgi:2-dehydro-3-deoxygalactonokinase